MVFYKIVVDFYYNPHLIQIKLLERQIFSFKRLKKPIQLFGHYLVTLLVKTENIASFFYARHNFNMAGELYMWKNVNGHLIPVTDDSRIKFRTTISKKILVQLEGLAEQHDTHINYLLETGIQKVLQSEFIQYDKSLRPKDRVQYKTTYDKELLTQLKQFAADRKLFTNDVIEYAVNFINPDKAHKRAYRSRIERL